MDFRTLPDRLQSEVNLVSVIADDGRRFLEVFDAIQPSDFSQEALGIAWGWFRELTEANVPITRYELNQRYGNHHAWETYRSLLSTLADGLMPMFLKDYARDVKAHAQRAAAQAGIARLHELAQASISQEEVTDGIRDLFETHCMDSATKGARKASAIVADILDKLANPVLIPRYRTGFSSLDAMLKGGLRDGQFTVIAGRTGGGKTVLGMNILTQIAIDGVPVVAFSLEMTDEDLIMRSIMSEGRIHGEEDAIDIVRKLPLYVDDTSDITARGIVAKIKLLKSRYQAKVFLVDYLQLLGVEKGSKENRERLVADMSRRLKVCARNEKVSIIALSQVNADGEMRESKAVEQDSDVVLHVVDVAETERDPNGKRGETRETGRYNFFIRVTKQRGGRSHGPIGRVNRDAPGIPVNFYGENFRFVEK